MLGEANYIYPSPTRIGGLSLWQGPGNEGEMSTPPRGNIYEEIVRRRRDPALVEARGLTA